MKKRKSKFRRFMLIFFLMGLFFLACTYPVMLYMISQSREVPPDNGRDVVIILGAGLSGSSVSMTLRERLDGAIPYIMENENAIVIVSGGQGPDELVSEAFAMKEYLIAHGISADRILMEDMSTSTKENFLFSKRLLDGVLDKPYSIVFVTNDFHCPRAGFYARKAGFDAQPLACATSVFMEKVHYPREYLALIWYYVIESWQMY